MNGVPEDKGGNVRTVSQQGRSLFMLWQDSCALASFLETSRLTREQFLEVPLARATPLRLLAIVGIHAHALTAETCASIAGVDWDCIRSLGGLADDALPYQASVVTLEASWEAATTTCPRMRRAIANDIRVVRERTRWENLLARTPGQWPVPNPERTSTGEGSRLVGDALDRVLEGFDVIRAWLLEGDDDVVVSLERGERLEPADVGKVRDTLARDLGRDVTVLVQDQLYPLVWDDVVTREVLAWEREGTSGTPSPRGPALPHAHRHVEVHGEADPAGATRG